MDSIFDNPIVGVIAVVVASIVLFVPSLIAHFRKIQASSSIAALNALMLLLLFNSLFSPPLLWGTFAVWVPSTVWALTGRRRES